MGSVEDFQGQSHYWTTTTMACLTLAKNILMMPKTFEKILCALMLQTGSGRLAIIDGNMN